MQLKFEGQSHSIDTNTLINVLVHYQTVVKEANKQLGCGTRNVSINVNAIEHGSFIIDLSIAQNVLGALFSNGSIEYVKNLTAVISDVYKLYKCFKGAPVKNKEDIARANITINGDVSVNVYNKPCTREAISKSIETSASDVNVDGFSVLNDTEDKVTFERKDFTSYLYDDFDKEDENKDIRTIEKDANLVIIGLNFERGSNWQFMYDGFKISVRVKDDALMQRIDNGERFGKGDAIKVKLRIVQKYNKNYNTYENKSYKIIAFYKHITHEQKELFDNI